jgi:hypothetical protein
MSSLAEIELAIGRLRPDEREELLAFVAASIRQERGTLPPVRNFSREEIDGWINADESEGESFRAGL